MPDADAALHEFIDAEFTIEGLSSAVAEQKLLAALEGRAGIRRTQISDGKLLVEYEPVCIVMACLVEAITAAGFKITDVVSAQASPVLDAVHPEAS